MARPEAHSADSPGRRARLRSPQRSPLRAQTRMVDGLATPPAVRVLETRLEHARRRLLHVCDQSHAELEAMRAVNALRERKVEDLDQSNRDLHNLLGAMTIACVFIEEELRVQSHTPPALALFGLIHSDIGRPLSDLATRSRSTPPRA